jgi:hypothetical protein
MTLRFLARKSHTKHIEPVHCHDGETNPQNFTFHFDIATHFSADTPNSRSQGRHSSLRNTMLAVIVPVVSLICCSVGQQKEV